MTTKFQIPRILQPHCQGLAELQLRGLTVNALLEELRRDHPSLYGCICDENGLVRRHIHLFVNNDFLQGRDDFDTPLEAEDVVSVFQAVSGG